MNGQNRQILPVFIECDGLGDGEPNKVGQLSTQEVPNEPVTAYQLSRLAHCLVGGPEPHGRTPRAHRLTAGGGAGGPAYT